MSATSTNIETSQAHQTSEVLALLSQILAMPDQQRLALSKAWAAMDPAFGLELGTQGNAYPVEDFQSGVVDSNDVEKLNNWIAEQHKLPPRERIETLQSILHSGTEEWETVILEAEIAKIKNANPWVAVELAVMKYAYQHPVLTLVALSGLGFGIYRFGKSIFSIVF
jgi:hypothetical protein